MLPALARILSGRRLVLPAMLAVQAIALVRNAIIARLLGPDQFGLAVTFLLAHQFLETATDTGLNKYLLQSKTGNKPSVQAVVQLLAATRGAVIAVLIVAIGFPLFKVLGVSSAIAPFLLLAAVSLSMGLLHYDNVRQQRNGVFLNDSLSSLAGEVMSLAACLVALQFTRSYIVVLYALAARSLTIALVSHLMSRRRYVLRYSRDLARAVLNFSWPLLLNGPLLFISSQSDRIFVGAVLGPHDLGLYSAALLLLYLPMGLLTRVLGTIFIPRLSKAYHAGDMTDVEKEFAGICLTVFLVAVTGFAALGPLVLVLVYGPAYAQGSLPVTLIGLTQAMRFLRTWPTGVALSIGRTGNLLLSTSVRLIALPLGLIGILLVEGFVGLAIGLLLGEAIALLVSVVALNMRRGGRATQDLREVGVAFAVAVGLPLAIWLIRPGIPLAIVIAGAFLVAAMGALGAIHRRLIPRDMKAFGW
jgi:lipopolysaccharide exporter